MFVRTPHQALRLIRDDLQAAASCLTASVLRVNVAGEASDRSAISFGGDRRRARVDGGPAWWISINLSVEMRQDEAESLGWRTHTRIYDLAVFDHEDQGDFLFAYHHHPSDDAEGVQTPHLHVNAKPRWSGGNLKKVHLATGRIPCEAFIRLLITDFGVNPTRTDWAKVLARTEARFAQRRTW